MGPPVTRIAGGSWHPRTPPLPEGLARLVRPDDPAGSPLVNGGHALAYPEGRIGLTADGWPERGRTGNRPTFSDPTRPDRPRRSWPSPAASSPRTSRDPGSGNRRASVLDRRPGG